MLEGSSTQMKARQEELKKDVVSVKCFLQNRLSAMKSKVAHVEEEICKVNEKVNYNDIMGNYEEKLTFVNQ